MYFFAQAAEAAAQEGIDWAKLLEQSLDYIQKEGPGWLRNFGLFLLILFVGRIVAKMLRRITIRVMKKGGVDQSIQSFVASLVYIAATVFVVIAALSVLGIQTASFVAVIGAAGLAIGLALQGSLSNFAAGFLVIIFKPYKIGDFIEGGGEKGTVNNIQLFTTTLKTPDNKTIIIPNSQITNGNITNYSTESTRRVDLVVGIGYGDDIDKARDIINKILDENKCVLKDSERTIAVSELADSSVNFVVRSWVKSDDYWTTYFALQEEVKKQFDKEGVSIPFPQRDVHVYEHKAE